MRQLLIVLAIIWAGAAQASQITILSITSGWDVERVVDTRNRNALLSGEGSNTIEWGETFKGHQGRSGFNFQQTAATDPKTSHAANTLFNVGTFTHMNRVIYEGEHVERARLNMTVEASFDGVVRTFNTSYVFSLWETPNYANPCANGGQNNLDSVGGVMGGAFDTVNMNGCADRVELLKNDALTEKFTHNGLVYEFELFGFESGAEFWTVEAMENDTFLRARFNVTPVPLPAGAWLLLGGLGGFALLKRRSARG